MAEKVKTYRVYESKGQLRITVPRVLAQAVGIKKGDRIMWKIDRGELVLRKAE
jgi:bifunctional DNA-binding transcriptional regulator/antitoxin component of YhaV-PrlF toxin-antitoxin module